MTIMIILGLTRYNIRKCIINIEHEVVFEVKTSNARQSDNDRALYDIRYDIVITIEI